MAMALRFICIVLLAGSIQGCSFLDIKCKVKNFIQKENSQFTGEAEQAFEQAMDHTFYQDISPLLDKAAAAAQAGMDEVDSDIRETVNETIRHIESSIMIIIQDAANAMASSETQSIEEITLRAAGAMEQVEIMFYQDASTLLTKINHYKQKGRCMEAGGVKLIQNRIYMLLKSIHPHVLWVHSLLA
jgi:hypothetical protein